jgi:hypothetical protein
MSVIPINMFIPIVTFGFTALKHFKLSVPDEAYSTNVPCTLNLGKAVTVQTKVKGPQKGVTSITLAECQLDSLSAREVI